MEPAAADAGAGPRFEDVSLQLPGFMVDVFAEFQATDALVVMAKGLGLDHVVVSSGMETNHTTTPPPPPLNCSIADYCGAPWRVLVF